MSDRRLGLHESSLCGIIGALRHQHGQERIDAGAVARLREQIIVGSCRLLALRCRKLVVDRRAARKRIGHLAESGLDGPLIFRKRGVALHFGEADVRVPCAGLENRVARIRACTEAECAAREETAERGAREAEQTRQRDPREKGCARGADIRIGGA